MFKVLIIQSLNKIKALSKFMFQMAFNLFNLSQTDLTPGTKIYSHRSAVKNAQTRFNESAVTKMCKNGHKILFVRHPILRIISAWNDKFNLNNTRQKSGVQYGIRILLRMKNHARRELEKIFEEWSENEVTSLCRRKCSKSCPIECIPKKPRLNRENPWHLLPLKTFLDYLTSNVPYRVDPHFSPISFITKSAVTRNPCQMNYTAVLKIEQMDSELAFLENFTSLSIPKGKFSKYQ